MKQGILLSRQSIKISILFSVLFLFGCTQKSSDKPNIVIFFTDDQGYNDLSCFGGTHVNTPNIDQMAQEGMKLTSFYVAGPLCSPSRAGLMTGSYPKRVGLATGSRFIVLLNDDEHALNLDEITIAELLKGQGYATGIFGKWHLGDQPEYLPTKQGFDEYFGIPYSLDIHPYHPNNDFFHFPPLPLYEGNKIIEKDPDADYLTQRVTQHAIRFIDNHKDEPFFLYIPHPMPHAPLHVSPPFMESVSDSIKNILKQEDGYVDYQTRRNLFSQVISEIDWSVGEVMAELKRQGLDNKTLVLFTSDNGPAIGSAFPLRGKKGSVYEGGMREPAVIRWPGVIPAGVVCDELLTSLDLFPTIAYLTGAKIPNDRIIDGKNIWPVLSGEKGAHSPHDRFFYHKGNNLMAVRSGDWKLHRNNENTFELYNLASDISEENNLAEEYPEIVSKLNQYMIDFDIEMEDSTKIRPCGLVEIDKNH
jgi:arylsulfatase A-like enzyme